MGERWCNLCHIVLFVYDCVLVIGGAHDCKMVSRRKMVQCVSDWAHECKMVSIGKRGCDLCMMVQFVSDCAIGVRWCV